MQTFKLPPLPPALENHKKLIVSVGGAIIFGLLGLYLVSLFNASGQQVTTVDSQNQAILGDVSPNFIIFLQAMTVDKPVLNDTSFIDSYLVRNSHDYTQVINPSLSRGRLDPFIPYAAAGSSR